MKENIIQAIVAKMQRNLDCRQMVQLKAVLASELHNVEIIEKKECAKQQAQENEHLLNSFISAKKIEGCSDKTLQMVFTHSFMPREPLLRHIS